MPAPARKKHINVRVNMEMLEKIKEVTDLDQSKIIQIGLELAYYNLVGAPRQHSKNLETCTTLPIFHDERDELESDKVDFDAIEDEPGPE